MGSRGKKILLLCSKEASASGFIKPFTKQDITDPPIQRIATVPLEFPELLQEGTNQAIKEVPANMFFNEPTKDGSLCYPMDKNMGSTSSISKSLKSPLQEEEESNDSISDKDYLPEQDHNSSSSPSEDEDFLQNPNTSSATNPDEAKSGERFFVKKTCPSSWQKNVRKRNKNCGNPYLNTKGLHIPGKQMDKPCNDKCRLKCSQRVSEDHRRDIFSAYWNLKNIDRQRDFINNLVDVSGCKRRTVGAVDNFRRTKTMKFTFNIKNTRVNICRTMFLNTLAIKKGVLNFAIKKRAPNSSTITTEHDRRGGYGTSKIKEESISFLKDHIKKFPTLPSHYSRRDTNKQYLDSKLNIAQMYKLYKIDCRENGRECLKECTYRKTFLTHFNLSFHRPKKDQCPICTTYQSANVESKANLQESYDLHIRLKEKARSEKTLDKNESKINETVHSCNFDLQQVLYVPKDPTNPILFYKTKLATYNFTIFDCGRSIGKCYYWTEVEAGRGPCEIASCLLHHLKSLPPNTTQVRLFSDTCGGQNKNQFVAAMFIYAVQALQFEVIDQKFLISGHSQMECDSMHARIETAAKNVPVYLPHGWATIAKNAKQNNPKYEVFQKKDILFLDWKALAKLIMVNRNKDEDGNVINWRHIKWIRYEKAKPFTMSVKTDFNEHFHTINILPRRGRRVTLSTMEKCLKPLYAEPRKISALKLKHLKEICNSGGVPDDCKLYFNSLLSDDQVKDTTVLPDVEDPEEDFFLGLN